MRVRKFDELKTLWNILGTYTSGDYLETRDSYILAMTMRVTHCVKEILYPGCRQVRDVGINEYGELTDEVLEDEVNPLFSNIVGDILAWFGESPFWDLQYGIYGTDGTYEDGNNEGPSADHMVEFMLNLLGDEELEDGGPLRMGLEEWYGFWEGYGSMSGQGFVIIVSYLYPYMKELKEAAGEEYAEMISYLEEAYKVIEGWMLQGDDVWQQTTKAGYFLSQGGNMFDDGYGTDCRDLGVCDYFYRILIAGEMVESIFFELDKKYHILPEEFGRRNQSKGD